MCFTNPCSIKLWRPDSYAWDPSRCTTSRWRQHHLPPLPPCTGPVTAVSSLSSLTLMGGGGIVEVAAEDSVCLCVCVCWMWCVPHRHTVQVSCPPPHYQLPLPTTGPRGRNKQSSDNGTSSCSPIRNRCGRRALERKKKQPQMVSACQAPWYKNISKHRQAAFSIPDGPMSLPFISSYSQRTVPCSLSRMCWRHQQSVFIHQCQGFFLPDQYWRRWCKLLEYILTKYWASAIHWCYLQSNQASKHLEQMAVAPSLLQFNCPDHPAQSAIEMWL